jgi:hypothetical protein
MSRESRVEKPKAESQEVKSRSRARFPSHDRGIGIKAVVSNFSSRPFDCLTLRLLYFSTA